MDALELSAFNHYCRINRVVRNHSQRATGHTLQSLGEQVAIQCEDANCIGTNIRDTAIYK